MCRVKTVHTGLVIKPNIFNVYQNILKHYPSIGINRSIEQNINRNLDGWIVTYIDRHIYTVG